MTIVFILLACAGLTFILKYGSILGWLRAPLLKIKLFKELFDCALCLGFWSGVIVGAFLYKTGWSDIFYLLPVASAAFCWAADGIVGVIQWAELDMKNKSTKK